MRKMKLRVQLWALVITARNASHNASNARGVSPGKMGSNSSVDNRQLLDYVNDRVLSIYCLFNSPICSVYDALQPST